ncbi:MAG: hypothetical protein FDZ69_14205, partial [Deltaproteobacteria bacterium]
MSKHRIGLWSAFLVAVVLGLAGEAAAAAGDMAAMGQALRDRPSASGGHQGGAGRTEGVPGGGGKKAGRPAAAPKATPLPVMAGSWARPAGRDAQPAGATAGERIRGALAWAGAPRGGRPAGDGTVAEGRPVRGLTAAQQAGLERLRGRVAGKGGAALAIG